MTIGILSNHHGYPWDTYRIDNIFMLNQFVFFDDHICIDFDGHQKGDRTTIPKEWGWRRIYSQLDQASRGACEEAFQAPLFDEFVCALDVEFASQVRSTR